jgi:hypothetical protein
MEIKIGKSRFALGRKAVKSSIIPFPVTCLFGDLFAVFLLETP